MYQLIQLSVNREIYLFCRRIKKCLKNSSERRNIAGYTCDVQPYINRLK